MFRSPLLAITASLISSSLASAAVVISEIDLAGKKVEIVNTGASTEDISGWWWCNRVNGSPFYISVSNFSIDAGLSSAGASYAALNAGEILVISLTNGVLPDGNGELGLFNTNSFGSASAIEDYVLWGAVGVRDLVAANAGIWTDDDPVDVSGLGTGDTIQLLPGVPGNSAADYGSGAGTLGAANVPEPGCAFLAGTGLSLLLRRRR